MKYAKRLVGAAIALGIAGALGFGGAIAAETPKRGPAQ